MSTSMMQKTTIINGSNVLAAAQRDNQIYRLEPISVVKEVSFHNLKGNVPHVFDLSQQLTEDYEVVAVTSDLLPDDDTPLDAPAKRSRIYRTSITLQEFYANRFLSYAQFNVQGFSKSLSGMPIKHDRIWKLQSNIDLNSLIFTCIPVIYDPPTKFVAIQEAQDDSQ